MVGEILRLALTPQDRFMDMDGDPGTSRCAVLRAPLRPDSNENTVLYYRTRAPDWSCEDGLLDPFTLRTFAFM